MRPVPFSDVEDRDNTELYENAMQALQDGDKSASSPRKSPSLSGRTRSRSIGALESGKLRPRQRGGSGLKAQNSSSGSDDEGSLSDSGGSPALGRSSKAQKVHARQKSMSRLSAVMKGSPLRGSKK